MERWQEGVRQRDSERTALNYEIQALYGFPGHSHSLFCQAKQACTCQFRIILSNEGALLGIKIIISKDRMLYVCKVLYNLFYFYFSVSRQAHLLSLYSTVMVVKLFLLSPLQYYHRARINFERPSEETLGRFIQSLWKRSFRRLCNVLWNPHFIILSL